MPDAPWPLLLNVQVFSLPKAGLPPEAYEDAAACSAPDRWPLCVAVADGATESIYAGDWARRLVKEVTTSEASPEEAVAGQLHAWQQAWHAEASRRAEGGPWYLGQKMEEGAHAALLGLTLTAEHTWQAAAWGDVCLFHLRDAVLLRAWPLETPEAFTNTPVLLPAAPHRPVPAPETCAGTWQPGDAFVGATDALAAWLLAEAPGRALTWDEARFTDEVHHARRQGTLRNDDVTAVVLRMPEEATR